MRLLLSVSLVVVLCAVQTVRVTAQCGAGLLYCQGINQCYSSGAYNCIPQATGGGNFLCPPNTCLCGNNICYTSQYGCKDGALTQDPKDADGHCPGGSGGDPLVRNFDGCRWYMEGQAGKVYNLVAGADDTVNTLLVPANLHDQYHDGNGTFHGALAFRHRDDIVEAHVDEQGNLTVTVNGNDQPLDSRFQLGDMKGKVVRHMTYFGQYAEISTPALKYAINSVQPFTTAEGDLQRGHLDLDITLRKSVAGLHGLLGQSSQNIQAPQCREDYLFPGEGTEADYEVSSLSSIPQGLSPVARVSRKLIEEDIDSLLPVTATTAA